MVEVDIRLFVTCRLCLDVTGHFQIDPSVQQHIKYCFDIDVEPFDGLPQLICKKCDSILREHYAIKKNFIDKQKELRTRVQDNVRNDTKSPCTIQAESDSYMSEVKAKKILRQEESDTSNYNVQFQGNTTRKKKKLKKKRIINRLMSSSCDESEPNDSVISQISMNVEKRESGDYSKPWDDKLNKYFVCKICSLRFQDKEEITKHVNKHKALQRKYKNVFEMSCSVLMEKSDKKPNICKRDCAVVYSSDSIIESKNNPFYYILYHPKTSRDTHEKCQSNKSVSEMITSNSEPTDDEISGSKRRRLISRSSSETVVINKHSEHEDTFVKENCDNPSTVIDCIDLDDSSDNESCDSNKQSSSSISIKNNEKPQSNPMHNIIKMCLKRHTKEKDHVEKKTSLNDNKVNEDLLQRKVLSIGRKVITKKGFNCTGLLRFLEYKDLNVVWKETCNLNSSNDGKYIRIATRVNEIKSNDVKNVGWKNFSDFKFYNHESYDYVRLLKKLKSLKNFKSATKSSCNVNEIKHMNSDEQLSCGSSTFSHVNTDLKITKTVSNSLSASKLLNKSPVSNPRQLPKKNNNNDNNSQSLKVYSAPNVVPLVSETEVEKNNQINTSPMPVVTSVVSLAQLNNKKNVEIPKEDSINKTDVNIPTENSINVSNNIPRPWIKVKPVSELMAEKPQLVVIPSEVQSSTQNIYVKWHNQISEQQVLATQVNSNAVNDSQICLNQNTLVKHNSNIVPLNNHDKSISINNESQCSTPSTSNNLNEQYVWLDTVEFPNTKTTSPYQYFQNLLLVHNITLLDGDQPLPVGSVCLIKLRLLYQPENFDPVNLSLLFFGFKNTFSIHVKDMNLLNVNIKKLTPFWQWQILKIYKPEHLVQKVLHAAEKLSAENYVYAKSFFSLLKSIKLINDST